MNLKFLFLFFLFHFLVLGQIKSGIITYGDRIIGVQLDTSKIQQHHLKQMAIQQMNQLKAALSEDDEVYRMVFKGSESRFEPIKKMNMGQNMAYQVAISNGVYYTDINKNKLFHQLDAFGELFLIDYDNQQIKWNLTNEIKIINGYKCYKAFTQIQNTSQDSSYVIAWYAIDLPINFGPKHYNGLPGLILELHERGHILYAKEIILNNDIKLDVPKKGRKITKKEFEKIDGRKFKPE